VTRAATDRPAAVQSARDAAKWVVRRWGMAAASARPVPELLVVGAKRGGTTSLWKYLDEHPGVLPNFPRAENIKGTYFFSSHYARGLRWYRSQFPSRWARARAPRRLGYVPVAIEATPYDLAHPLAPARAAAVAPHAIVVAVLRDPVERTFSHWKERREHTETLSFEDALVAEAARCEGEEARILADPDVVSFAHRHQSYVGQSTYLPMLERWYAHFPADQILVWISEEFYADPQPHMDRLTARLGLPPRPLVNARPYNAVPAPDMDPRTRRELVELFAPQVEQLRAFLGRDLPWLGAAHTTS
jgi:Sulfotransferase domain